MKHGFFAVVALFLGFGATVLIPACSANNPTAGPTGPQGQAGQSAVPTPYCTNPSSNGLTVAGTISALQFSGDIYADAVTLANTVGISLSVNLAAGPVTGQVRMAVYADNGGTPGILVAQTNPQPTVAGWNTVSLPNVYLPNGTYWITHMFSNDTLETYNSTGGNVKLVTYGWGQFPTTFPSGASTGTYQDAMYISTCP
jgi:hypothetical protein